MIQPRSEYLPLLAALRDPPLADGIFLLSLPSPAAERATAAFDAVAATLARHAWRPWRNGSEVAGCSAPETSLLRLLAALHEGQAELAGRLLEWLLRPAGRRAMGEQAMVLAHALAMGAEAWEALPPKRSTGNKCVGTPIKLLVKTEV